MGYYFLTILLVLLPTLLIFIIDSLFFTGKSSNSSKILPPGPKPWPIIGNIHLLGTKPHKSITKLAQKYGPIMSLKLGSITTIVISSPEVAKEMFTNHDMALSSRQVPLAATIDKHHQHSLIFLPVCPKWHNFRKIAAIHLFTNQRLDSSQGLRRKKVDELVEYIKSYCDKGLTVDIGKAAFTTSLNLLSNTFFSFDLAGHYSGYSTEFKQLICNLSEEVAKPNVSDFFPILKGLDLQGVVRRMKVYFKQLWDVFDEIVDERLRDSKGLKDDVLDTLLKLVAKQELSIDDVKHVLMDFFAAGTETTFITLEWAMTELLRHPEKMAIVQAEIDKIIDKDGSVQESDIPKLEYVQAVVKEILRLHPPTPFLVPHKAEKEVQLCGYYVPKNAQIFVNIWSIGHDSSVWQNSESFLPERFLGREMNMKGKDFELMPFGSGKRICPGIPLGYRMVHLMLATLLHSFDWKLPYGMNPKDIDIEDKFGLTLQKEKSLQIVPKLK